MFVVCRSFDELEAEMLQGQKLQVYICNYHEISQLCTMRMMAMKHVLALFTLLIVCGGKLGGFVLRVHKQS